MQVKHVFRTPHFWIILAVMACGAIIFYYDQIPGVQTIMPPATVQLARFSTYRILSIIPVVYAAFIFRFKGGVITAIFIFLALLPRAMFVSPETVEAITETSAFLLIGLFASWLIWREQQAVNQLEKAHHRTLSNQRLQSQ